MKQTFGSGYGHGKNMNDEAMWRREVPKPGKGWYAVRRAKLMDEEAFAEIEEEEFDQDDVSQSMVSAAPLSPR
ncbi:MAG: hypothetical protein KGL90_00375 [Burkholderiales bacterium]|nr:hypothetical protein [Burkholderiales bacterium]